MTENKLNNMDVKRNNRSRVYNLLVRKSLDQNH